MIRALPAVLAAGWALLLAAWVVGNPPFASQDEVDHYRRAIGISQGELIGKHTPELPGGVNDLQRKWNRNLAYSVDVPAGMGTPPIGCYNADAGTSAECFTGHDSPDRETTEVSQVGNYPPLPYLAPAAVLQVADSPFTDGKPNGYLSFRSEIWRDRTVVASRWAKVVAGAGSVRSSAGT